MSVTQLKDGRWLCRYPKGKNPENPNSTKKYFGRGLDAEQRAIAFDIALGLGKNTVNSGATFVELTNDYLRSKQHGGMAESTFDKACYKLEKKYTSFLW